LSDNTVIWTEFIFLQETLRIISWTVYVSVFLEMTVNSSTWSSGAEKIWSSGKNSKYATLIGTHQPIMLRHQTQLFCIRCSFF